MKALLHLKTSLFADQGVSSQLAADLLSRINPQGRHWTVTSRDFNHDPVPHLDATKLQALSTPAEKRDPRQQAQVAYGDKLIAELQGAELIIIQAPMYNFGIPSMLKAWLDHVARAGVTFRYTAQGPVGLLTGKQVIVIATSGGKHQAGQTDHVSPYLRTMLGFLGLTDVDWVYAQGLNMGEEQRAAGLKEARRQIDALVAKLHLSALDRSAA